MNDSDITPDIFSALFTTQSATGLDKAHKELENLLPHALRILEQVLNSNDATLEQKFRAAKTVIDLTSHGKDRFRSPSQPDPSQILQNLTPSELKTLRTDASRILAKWEQASTTD